MKWLAVLLMIANVTLYLWMSGHREPSGGQDLPAKPEVNRSGMLLLSEVRRVVANQPAARVTQGAPKKPVLPVTVDTTESKERGALVIAREHDASNPAVAPAPAPAPAPGAVASVDRKPADKPFKPELAATLGQEREVAKPVVPVPAVEPAPVVKTVCYRIGPFKDKPQLSGVTVGLTREGKEYRVVQGQERQLQATRVYLGPFVEKIAADAMLRKVRSLASDAYQYQSAGQHRVQLGYFTQEELARKYVVALEEKGLQAKTEQEFRTLGPIDWLEVRLPDQEVDALRNRDWGNRDVEMKAVDCPN